MNRYQWTVLFAAWLGWGFDVFDGLLFNYVAPNCIPTLLGLPIGSLAARQATLHWGGIRVHPDEIMPPRLAPRFRRPRPRKRPGTC